MYVAKKQWQFKVNRFWHVFNYPVEISKVSAVRFIKDKQEKKGMKVRIQVR